MAIEFTETTDPPGLALFDSIEQRQLKIRTDKPVELEPSDSDQFCFPVDASYAIEVSSLVFDQSYVLHIHGKDGRAREHLEAGNSYELNEDTQFIGMDGPMKLYCHINGPGTIEVGMTMTRLTFERPERVEIGVRSLHERPEGTITTPPESNSIMKAMSAMTSALKTDSPERSWPTLRGYPPLIELGEEFCTETIGTPIDTGISIEVPPRLQHIYTVAPLAFYLGADVIPGESPKIKTEFDSYEFNSHRNLEDDIARTLKQVFFLDCLVRTVGVYQFELHELTALEEKLPWNVESLYGESLSVQLDHYLDVDFATLRPHIPRWPMTAHIPPTPESAEVLPFVVNELGIIRVPRGKRHSVDTSIDALSPTGQTHTNLFARSSSTRSDSSTSPQSDFGKVTVVEPDITDESIEHAWFGDDIPIGASKATVEGYRSQIDQGERGQSIDILVVCNDARMLDEHDLLDETYGNRDVLSFNITSEFGVSTSKLTDLLENGGFDFLHYIGHATNEGLRCSDGDLDIESIDDVDLGVFFLNACHSYEQGLALAKRGAFGGVATVGDIVNEHAIDSGAALARLLNLGIPLRGALEIVRERTILGDQYLVVGDGSTDIAQSDGGPPTIVTVNDHVDDEIDVWIRNYPTKEFQIGSLALPKINSSERMHLLPLHNFHTKVQKSELESFFTLTRTPVIIDDTLHWNTDIGPPSFYETF